MRIGSTKYIIENYSRGENESALECACNSTAVSHCELYMNDDGVIRGHNIGPLHEMLFYISLNKLVMN